MYVFPKNTVLTMEFNNTDLKKKIITIRPILSTFLNNSHSQVQKVRGKV